MPQPVQPVSPVARPVVTAGVTPGGILPPSGDELVRVRGERVLPGNVPGRVHVAPDFSEPMPTEVGLGTATIHRYDDARANPPHIAKTVYLPVPTDAVPGELRDTNAKPFDERLPERFILGDGGLTRSLIGVDLRAGSDLDKRLADLVARIPQRHGRYESGDVIEWVRANVGSILRWTAGSSYNDGRAEFDWDRGIEVGEVEDDFTAVAFAGVDETPRATVPLETFPVVPFERYLEKGQGYCIQKALLAALILDRTGVPFRLVNGAVDGGPGKTTGHTWIELADGRVLDAAWGKVARPGEAHADHPDWFRFGGSFRFANQRYPYLALA